MSALPPTAQASPRDKRIGRLAIVLAALLWSTSGLFAKSPAFDTWPVSERGLLLAFWRALFAGLLLLPLVRRPSWSWRFVPMLACFAVMNVSFLSAMVLTTSAATIWLQYTAPAWVFLLGAAMLGERATRGDRWMLACSAIGVGTILVSETRGQSHAGVALGLLSGVTFALVVLFLRKLCEHQAAWLTALNLLVTAVVLLPFATRTAHVPTASQFGLLAAFGILQMGLPYVLFSYGLRKVSGGEAALLALLEPVLVPVWVYQAWGEVPASATLIGGLIILAGLVTRYGPAVTYRRG